MKKQWIGILLLLLALGGLFAWETWGRDRFLTQSVLVAKEPIPAGTTLSAELFSEAHIDTRAVAAGALTPQDIGALQGKTTFAAVPQNGQISRSQLQSDTLSLQEGESLYPVKGDWIALRSSTLRRGDWITIYALSDPFGHHEVGTYQIAFVRDMDAAEVGKRVGESADLLHRGSEEEEPYSLEIIATRETYEAILNEVNYAAPEQLETAATARGSGKAVFLVVQTKAPEKGENQ